MDFLKKHYEKLLLGVVLVGLALAAAFLPMKIQSERQSLEDLRANKTNPKVKPLTNLDLTIAESTLKRALTPPTVDLSAPNKLFNPMPWQKRQDNTLIPGTKVGAGAVVVTRLSPLYLKLSLDNVTASESGARYVIGVEREAALNPAQRPKRQTYASLNTKTEAFVLREVKGPAENPSQVILELNDTGERVAVTREQPFRRVDGYMADLRYEPEKKSWTNRRVGMTITFNGEDYNIVAINQSEVVLSARSNQKKWTIKYTATP
jgi:hypothetical protein